MCVCVCVCVYECVPEKYLSFAFNSLSHIIMRNLGRSSPLFTSSSSMSFS